MIDAARARGVPVVVAGSDASDHPDDLSRSRRRRRRRRRRRGDARRGARRARAARTHAAADRRAGAVLRARQRRDRPHARRARSSAISTRCRGRRGISSTSSATAASWLRASRLLLDERRRRPAAARTTATGARSRSTGSATPRDRPSAVVDEIAWLKRDLPARPPVDRRRHLRPEARLDRALRRPDRRARGASCRSSACCAPTAYADAIARALQRAGCRTAWIGAESGSQRILDAMEKGTRVEQIAAAARRLHDAGIEVGFFLQFGYPGETLRGHRAARCRWCATAGPTTSACRCRTRCRARRSTSA